MRFLELLIASLFAFLFTRVAGAVAPAEGEAKRADRTQGRRLMVRCSSCGVYVLRERALPMAGGSFLCSSSCRGTR
jgi:hypothetical protein